MNLEISNQLICWNYGINYSLRFINTPLKSLGKEIVPDDDIKFHYSPLPPPQICFIKTQHLKQ